MCAYRYGQEYSVVIAKPATRREAESIRINLGMQGVDCVVAVADSEDGVNVSVKPDDEATARNVLAQLGLT